jgi:hypothetical protein
MDFDEYETVRFGSLIQRIFQFSFRADIKPQSSSEYVYELVILPGLDIVVRAVTDHPFNRIPVIIDEKDDGSETVPDHRREVLTSNLKRTIPYK